MKVVAIVSQKGGTGKTTLSYHLATEAAASGHSAGLIDLDPQASAEYWGDQRGTESPAVISGKAPRVPKLLASAKDRGATFVVIDTGHTADDTARVAAEAADIVLIPCRAAALDLHAIAATIRLIEAAKKPAYVVLNFVRPRTLAPDEAEELLKAEGFQVAPRRVGDRVAFEYAAAGGRTAGEFEPKGKAAREVQKLYEWVCDAAGIPREGPYEVEE